MIRRNIFIFTLLISLIALFAARNLILKTFITHHFQKHYQLDIDIEKLSLSLSTLKISRLTLGNNHFTLKAREAAVNFAFKGLTKPEISAVRLDNAQLHVPELDDFKNFLLTLTPPRPVPAPASRDLAFNLTLNDISLNIASGKDIKLTALFSFDGAISQSRISRIAALSIAAFKLKTKDIAFSARLLPQERLYRLFIDSFTYKDEALKEMAFTAAIDENKTIITSESFILLGLGAFLRLEFFYEDYQRICLGAALKNVSFREAGRFFGLEESLSLSGPFAGDAAVCFKQGGIDEFQGALTALAKGTITIERELALDFLKEHLDKKSYNTLVDSFQNYNYNSGAIGISKKGKVITLHFDFNSSSGGKRDITVNYHMPGGGK
jgi:hypothetical protein